MTQSNCPGARKTLRERMNDAMILRGFAARTQESYLAAVRSLAKHYRRSPDLLAPEEIEAYHLHLIVVRKLAYASVNQSACACRFLFDKVLRRPLSRFDIPMAKARKTLPRVLSRDEVTRLFAATPNPRARTLLMTTYAAGLRVSELCALQLADIESAGDSHVHQGAPRQGREGSLHNALPAIAANPARLLASVSPAHLVIPQPIRQWADRYQGGTAHLRRGARSRRAGA